MARDTNFYYSFLVLPAEKREAIGIVWDFCRAVDDAVDEAGVGDASREVERWRKEVAAVFGAGAPATPQGRALVPLVSRFNLPQSVFNALVEGVAMDIGSRRYEAFEDLYEYCIRVASAVGLMCLEIFGYSDPRARDYAVDLGIALQLTNILRDVGADAADGRTYLPQEDLRRFGCVDADLRAGRLTSNVRDLLAFEAARAREYYATAAKLAAQLDARALVSAVIMGRIYHETLDRIERAGFDVFSERIRVPRRRRIAIAVAAWIRTRFHHVDVTA